MIIENTKKNIRTSGNIQSASCTIDAEDMRYIQSLLRNNYSDTMLATIREIIANALDVTVNKKPEIKLPTQIEPFFCVRDYGVGLSEEDMLGLYTKYGKSTKRNDNNAIGGFGIGRFAPLSYSDSFIISSVVSRRKVTYSIRVDENDNTVVSKMSDEHSVEDNGVYIQVPIAEKDVAKFKEKFKNFSHYLKDKIVVLNETFERTKPKLSLDSFDYFSDQNNYYSSDVKCRNAYVLMGGIMYPVTPSEKYGALVKGLVYKAKIGEFKLHHSRESLEYNDRTVSALIRASDLIEKDLEIFANEKIKNASNLYEATVLLGEFKKSIRGICGPYAFKKLQVNFNGFKVSTSLFLNSYDFHDVSVAVKNKFGGINVRKPRYGFTFLPNKGKFFVIDDGVTPKSLANRMSFLKDGEQALILTCKVLKEDAIIERKNAMNDKHVLLLSECERVIVPRIKTASKGISTLKGDILEFVGDTHRDAYAWATPSEEFDDNKTYYYVRYHANKVRTKDNEVFPHLGEVYNFSNFVSALKNSMSLDFKIYGVRSKKIQKISKLKNWVAFEDVYENWIQSSEEIREFAKQIKLHSVYLPITRSRALNCILSEIEPANQVVKNLKKLFIDFKAIDSSKYSKLYKCSKIIESIIKVDASSEEKALSEFKEKFPLVKHLMNDYDADEEKVKDLIEYLNRW